MDDIAPFRHRHDGWTPARQLVFLARLAETGCVADACRAAGLSTTSARRAYKRMPGFADRWDVALAAPRPILEQAAFDRAVHGVEIAVHRNGRVVATHRRYSDGLLRFLLERDDRRAMRRAEPEAPIEEVRGEILRRIEQTARANEERSRREALAFAERMRLEGKAP